MRLIRDKIALRVAKEGVTCAAVHGEARRKAIDEKIVEEVEEFLNATTREERIAEAADVLTVLLESTEADGYATADLQIAETLKSAENGRFVRGIVADVPKKPLPRRLVLLTVGEGLCPFCHHGGFTNPGRTAGMRYCTACGAIALVGRSAERSI
jgi:predicted house-cleaning noncanonical NTP pyrophosphatase (MazG superfamily)